MKTLHVTVRLGVGSDDDGAFDKYEATDLHNALCRAFPLCHYDAIEVDELEEGSVLARALELRGLSLQIHDNPITNRWVVWLHAPDDPSVIHVVSHENLPTAIGLAFAEYDDENHDDDDDEDDDEPPQVPS